MRGPILVPVRGPPPGTLFEVRIKRNWHDPRQFTDEGSFTTDVGKNQTTRIDWCIK